MPKQPAILGLRDALKKVTRREQFLAEMACGKIIGHVNTFASSYLASSLDKWCQGRV